MSLRSRKRCGMVSLSAYFDEDNQSELTEERVQAWATQLKGRWAIVVNLNPQDDSRCRSLIALGIGDWARF